MTKSRLLLIVRALLLVAMVAAVGAYLVSCSESTEGTAKPNQPPKVWLSSAPPEGTTNSYVIRMFWGGWDPDGEIAYYEYSITDNGNGPFDPADTTGSDKWHKVVGNDSLFSFTADLPADTNATDMASEFRRSHTFFIRAVDEQGMASREPAYRSFTARTISPEVRIQIPRRIGLNPAQVPPISTFTWLAFDYVDNLTQQQDPDSVQWILESTANHNDNFDATIQWIRDLPPDSDEWDPWVWYGAPQDSGKFWTTKPLEFGPYIFAIRAKDEAGAVTPVLDEFYNVRRIQVSRRSTGPILTLQNTFLGTVQTAVCNAGLTILDLPAGVPLEFCWSADASHYGGAVTGYRYGWDIADPEDPDQWEVDYTPFTTTEACAPERTFYFGTHLFTIEVIDNSGFCSRIEIKINIVQFTMTRNLLLIDDFIENPVQAGWTNRYGRGVLPNDEEHDEFWNDMLSEVVGFDQDTDVLPVTGTDVVPLTQMANYKSMIWNVLGHVDTPVDDRPLLYDLIQFERKNPEQGGATTGGKKQPNLLALFLAAGGHLMIAGQHPVSMVVNPSIAGGLRYPIIFQYELEGDQEGRPDIEDPPGNQSFAFKDLCVDVMDFAITGYSRWRTQDLNCPVTTLRHVLPTGKRDHGMRAGIPLDPNFPRIELRPETAGVNKAHQPSEAGLSVEVYNPQYFFDACQFTPSHSRACFQPIFGLECLDSSEPTFGQPVAFWTTVYQDRIAEVPGAVQARSVVYGFPPVMFKPAQVKPGIEHILFDEWQLEKLQ